MALQFEIPTVGKKVRVVSRYKDIYIHSTDEYINDVVEGVVVPNNKLARLNSFTVRTGCNYVPVREIAIGNVTDIEYLDGTVAKRGEIKNEMQSFEVQGSKGEKYIVTKLGNKVSCTCVGFQFRRTCRHLDLIK